MVQTGYPDGGYSPSRIDSPPQLAVRWLRGFQDRGDSNRAPDVLAQRSGALTHFGGMVLKSYNQRQTLSGIIPSISVDSGLAWKFPKVGRARARAHQAGQELMGSDIPTGEITITADVLYTSDTNIYDLDKYLAHWSGLDEFAYQMGQALANNTDRQKFASALQAAREVRTNDLPSDRFPSGGVIGVAYETGATNAKSRTTGGAMSYPLFNLGVVNKKGGGLGYDGYQWVLAIREANRRMFYNHIPMEEMKFLFTSYEVFQAIKWAQQVDPDIIGNESKQATEFIYQHRDYIGGTAGSFLMNGMEHIMVDSVAVVPSFNFTTIAGLDLRNQKSKRFNYTNADDFKKGYVGSYGDVEGQDNRVLNDAGNGTEDGKLGNSMWTKYWGNYAFTEAIMITKDSIRGVMFQDITMEAYRDTRRLSDFVVAKCLEGFGTLRRETAYEFSSYTFTGTNAQKRFEAWLAYRRIGGAGTPEGSSFTDATSSAAAVGFDNDNAVSLYKVPASALPYTGNYGNTQISPTTAGRDYTGNAGFSNY